MKVGKREGELPQQQHLLKDSRIFYFFNSRRMSTYNYVDEGLAAWPRHANIVSRLEIPIDIDVKDGLSRFLFDFAKVFSKDLNSLVDRVVTSIVAANDRLALQVCDKDSRSDHGALALFCLLFIVSVLCRVLRDWNDQRYNARKNLI